jgi:hypothetical protein
VIGHPLHADQLALGHEEAGSIVED